MSEDMVGEFGLCGHSQEYEYALADYERLRFAKGELPPPHKVEEQPQLPSTEWGELQLQKANRNYDMDYIRNGICELVKVIGEQETMVLAGRAARLIDLQYASQTRALLQAEDGDLGAAAQYLESMFSGLGDETEIIDNNNGVTLGQTGLRIVRRMKNVIYY